MLQKYPLIRKIYLYLFALIGLALITVGGVRLVALGLKALVLTKADEFYVYPEARPVKPKADTGQEYVPPSREEIAEYQKNQRDSNRQREAAEALAQIVIGLPLYFYHWSVIKRDKKEEERSK